MRSSLRTTQAQPAGERLCGVPVKLIALGSLTLQTVGMIFVLRLSRTQHVDGPRYLTSTAIFLAEPLKFVVSIALHAYTSADRSEFFGELRQHIVTQPVEMLKTAMPGLLYSLQNNLLFIGLSGLTASTYQLTCQLKVLTTAMVSVIILGTRLNGEKWFALVVLTVGVTIANMSGNEAHTSGNTDHPDTPTGLMATVAACFTSALAGVYIEKLLKQTTASIWIRNIQFATWGTLFSGMIVYRADGRAIAEHGFFQGWNALVCVVVLSHALGGMCIAMVLKYADNILKGFSGALAIVFSSALSVLVFHEATLDKRLVIGVILVILSVNIYGFGVPTVATIRSLGATKNERRHIAVGEGPRNSAVADGERNP